MINAVAVIMALGYIACISALFQDAIETMIDGFSSNKNGMTKAKRPSHK